MPDLLSVVAIALEPDGAVLADCVVWCGVVWCVVVCGGRYVT